MKEKIKQLLKPLLVKLIMLYRVDNNDFAHFEDYDYWQKKGFHIIPNHFYQPIPDTSKIKHSFFEHESKMAGIDMKEKNQLNLLSKFKKFRNEYSKFSKINKKINDQTDPNFYFDNLAFDGVDALVYYCLIRYLRPQKIIEVGSGWSTKIAAEAALKNKTTKLISIEPYPQPILEKGFPGLFKLIEKEVQAVPFDQFENLEANDILFIDSSHTVKIGGDVNYLFFEILPRLKKGVYIHIHDIFFPYDYPEDWVMKEHRFWAEQYLLQAFLIHNDSFEIVYSNSFMRNKYPKAVKKIFPNSPFYEGGSIWLKKIK